MASQNDLQGQIRVGVINRGFKGDTPDDHSLNHGVRDINAGPDVNNEDCGFWPMSINPTGGDSCEFGGALPPAQLVYYMKNAGQTGGIILGLANSIKNGGTGGGGGGQNLLGDAVQELMNTTIGINIPPQIQESTERGAKVRKIKEKDQQFSSSLLDGLPFHAALHAMSGFRTPAVKKVPTARQTNDQMMTMDVFNQLSGQIMSLAQMFQGLTQNGAGGGQGGASAAQAGGLGNGQSYWQDIHDNLTPNMSAALNNLSTLIQGHETDSGVGYVTGGVVHYGIYLENATALLSQVQSIDDLMNVLQRLQFDTSIMGHEALDNVVVQIENAWGTALQEVDFNGTITISYANANSQMEFANSMSNTTYAGSASSAPAPAPYFGGGNQGSGSGGANAGQIAGQVQSLMGQMFGKSAGTLQDMWKRLAPSGEKTATDLHKKLTQQQEAQKRKQVNDATLKNQGDPFAVFTQSQ
jgi:hypothetical protein